VTQRSRDLVVGPLSLDYFMRKAAEGWTVAAVEWTREVDARERTTMAASVGTNLKPEDVPYGLQITRDGLHLEANPIETTILLLILERIVMEKRLTQIADDLNERGLKTRRGTPWTASNLFELLPRLVEAGPNLLKSPEWRERRSQITAPGP